MGKHKYYNDDYRDYTDYDNEDDVLNENIDWEERAIQEEYKYNDEEDTSNSKNDDDDGDDSVTYDENYDENDDNEYDESLDDEYGGRKKQKRTRTEVEDVDELTRVLRDTPVTKKTMEERRQTFIEIMEDYHSGDKKKRDKAVEDAIKELDAFIKYTIKKKYSSYSKKHYMDLLQEGYVGIMEGMKKYDPNITMPTTFFYPYIIHEMQNLITKQVDNTTAHYATNIKKINKVIDEFEAQGKKWTMVDISIQTGMTLETIAQCLDIRRYRDEIHIDNCPEGLTETRAFYTKELTPEQAVMEQSDKDILESVLQKLDPLEVTVLEYRYGIHDHETMSEGDTAKALGMPKDRVKKILNGAIRKLRASNLRETFRDNYTEENRAAKSSTPALIPVGVVDNDIMALLEAEGLVDGDSG